MVTAFNLVSDHISVRLLQSPETQYTKQQAPLQKNWMWAIMLWVGIFKKAIKICIKNTQLPVSFATRTKKSKSLMLIANN